MCGDLPSPPCASINAAATPLHRRDLVQFRNVAGRELVVAGVHVGVDLVGLDRAGDDTGDERFRQQPRKRDTEHVELLAVAEVAELIDELEIFVVPEHVGETALGRQSRVPSGVRRIAAVLAGEKSAGEREIGNERQPVLLRSREAGRARCRA